MSDVLLAELKVDVYETPISINKAYSTVRGMRILTKEGKKFEARVTECVARATTQLAVSWKDVIDSVYKHGGSVRLLIELHMPDLLNGSWVVGGSTTNSGTQRSPYKKLDGSNYIKLLEDAIVKGTGIDDSCHLETTIRKIKSADPVIRIIYQVFE
jgi:Holliday junction resolvase RusA-like endonuclease